MELLINCGLFPESKALLQPRWSHNAVRDLSEAFYTVIGIDEIRGFERILDEVLMILESLQLEGFKILPFWKMRRCKFFTIGITRIDVGVVVLIKM